MPRDSELDRLRAARDVAFERKQAAYQIMDEAWSRRFAAREVLDRAYQEKQAAYGVQDAAWQEYQGIRSSNGPRIDRLNSYQEEAFRNMKDAFDNASSAYETRDGASARAYADEGHRYKAESQDYVAERRLLVQEIRDAREHHESTRPAFQQAKLAFSRAKEDHDRAKEDHERKRAEFKQAKAVFDQAAVDWEDRLKAVRAESARRQEDKRSLAEQAGVPHQYVDDVWISRKPDGTVNIYFGGEGSPDGPGHGHYVMDAGGNITYKRDPSDPHGHQNFTEPQYWHKVRMSADRDSDSLQADNYIGIVGSKGQKSKAHIVVNDKGDIVYARDIGGEIFYSHKEGIGHLPEDLDWSK